MQLYSTDKNGINLQYPYCKCHNCAYSDNIFIYSPAFMCIIFAVHFMQLKKNVAGNKRCLLHFVVQNDLIHVISSIELSTADQTKV